MTLVELFPPSAWIMNLKARDKKAAIREMIQHLVQGGQLKGEAARKAEKAVQKRESEGSTAIGKGLAIPHAKGCAFLKEVHGVFARSREGLPFDAVDGANVHVLFLVVSPEEQMSEHVNIMRRIAKMHTDEKTLKFLASNTILESLEEILKEVDDSFS
ncbi:MAG TPA: PTS sugar transporter subunit IIA [Planctomycetota bacterium]|jgi:mannitol/fructose-specific phosphotransferase system IIA component (Ntr-type)|nr:PTS sugar transporter subunit IIA [Planctomycetota bacterium]